MKTLSSKLFAAGLALFVLTAASCKKEQQLPLADKSITAAYPAAVTGTYTNGFFIINEGWFGHGDGSASFYSYDTHTKSDSIFTKENPGKNLDPATSTLEYGTVFNNQLFLVSKVGGPVVVADANTLKEVGRIPAASGNNWQSFLGLTSTTGLLSSANQ